jgi:hypothetical protein
MCMRHAVRGSRRSGALTWQGGVLVASLLGGCGLPFNGPPRVATVSPLGSLGRGPQSELEAARELAQDYRAELLSAAGFTDIAQDACNEGWLRAFPRDLTTAQQERTADIVDRLEKLITEYGVAEPLDTPQGRDLLRTAVLWETGYDRPIWDVMDGKANRQAIASGLMGRMTDLRTGRCIAETPVDSMLVVLPPVSAMSVSTRKGGVVPRFVFGERGLRSERERFWAARPAADSMASLPYSRISATLLWQEFAVVTVVRPIERPDGSAHPKGNGGGTFIFHRVGDEWRLLVIARTWG